MSSEPHTSKLSSQAVRPYPGPSAVSGALGGYKVNQLTAMLAGVVVGGAVAALRGNPLLAGAYSGGVAGTIIGVPYGLWGAAQGYGDAKDAKAQYEQLVAENQAMRQKLSWVERAVQSNGSKPDLQR